MAEQKTGNGVNSAVPVIAIDGPSGAGKGTIAQLLANKLGFHLLDSGALYRLLALSAKSHGVDTANEEALKVLAEHMDVQFEAYDKGYRIILEGEEVTNAIRNEEIGRLASQIAVFPGVRGALLSRQRVFREKPGLIADGRDMGTVVFPDATLKIFLTASPQERAKRRFKQLKQKGYSGSLGRLAEDIRARDEQDANRAVAPLVPAEDAVVIDSTELTVEGVFLRIMDEIESSKCLD